VLSETTPAIDEALAVVREVLQELVLTRYALDRRDDKGTSTHLEEEA
jgi:hypothetical protein